MDGGKEYLDIYHKIDNDSKFPSFTQEDMLHELTLALAVQKVKHLRKPPAVSSSIGDYSLVSLEVRPLD